MGLIRASISERPEGQVISVSRSSGYTFSKEPRETIRLLTGVGVDGDIHAGATVKHRSRARVDPSQPNLRQVHLIHSELHAELDANGFAIAPGQMGENITTRGVALLDLPTGTLLHIGAVAVVELTGLRNPCAQLDAFQPGLMAAVLERTASGALVRKAGVMGIVSTGGEVHRGDSIQVELPSMPHRPLGPV